MGESEEETKLKINHWKFPSFNSIMLYNYCQRGKEINELDTKLEKLEEEIREISGLKKNIARINELEQQ